MRVARGTAVLRPLLIAALFAAAGCTGNATEPGTIKSLSPTPTTSSASPTPTPTETPVKQQVKIAIRAYYAELTHAVRTGDSTALKRIVSPRCPCYRSVEVIERNKRQGRTGPSASISVRRVSVHDVAGVTAGAMVSYRVHAYDLVDEHDDVVSHIAARSYHADLSLVHRNAAWILNNVFNLAAI